MWINRSFLSDGMQKYTNSNSRLNFNSIIFHLQIKCDQYWPNQSSEKFGNITVVVLETMELAHYTVRTFRLYKVNTVYLQVHEFIIV